MYKKQLYQFLPVSFVLIAVESIAHYTTLPITNTIFWWGVQALLLFGFWLYKKNVYKPGDNAPHLVIRLFLLWMLINSVRGLFLASDYWHYKGLVMNTMVFLIPMAVYAFGNILMVQRTLGVYVKYALPAFFIVFFFISTDAYGIYLIPVSILIFFLPAMRSPWRLLTVGIAVVVFLADLSARSNVIKFGTPFLFLSIYYFQQILSKKMLEFGRLFLIVLPVVFFILGITGVFNVFNISSYVENDYKVATTNAKGEQRKIPITADTRTFIYAEVLQTAQKYNSWWMGRSLAHGYETTYFQNLVTGNERLRSEAAIPNIFITTGIIGVILYFLVFYRASYLAVNNSNNIYSKMLGLFIAFRWSYAWVEDINQFSLDYLVIWMMIGLCFSRSFRSLDNKEVTHWVRGIFSTDYAKAWFRSLSKDMQQKIY